MIFLIIHQFGSKYLKNHIFGRLDDFSTLYNVFGLSVDFSTLYTAFDRDDVKNHM